MKKVDNNQDIKRCFLASVSIALAMMCMALIITLKNTPEITILEINKQLPHIFCYVFICLTSVIISSVLILVLFKLSNLSILHTAIHLLVKKLSIRTLTRNYNFISPCLQMFLYETIKRNNDILHISLGQDISSLNPLGYEVHNECVFYRFNITAPEKPEFDNEMLQQLLQSYITSELKHYGIHGLSAMYKSVTSLCYSVYVDRVFYDEQNNCLSLDILYICTENSAKYHLNAIQRDTKTIKAERTVFDDEV